MELPSYSYRCINFPPRVGDLGVLLEYRHRYPSCHRTHRRDFCVHPATCILLSKTFCDVAKRTPSTTQSAPAVKTYDIADTVVLKYSISAKTKMQQPASSTVPMELSDVLTAASGQCTLFFPSRGVRFRCKEAPLSPFDTRHDCYAVTLSEIQIGRRRVMDQRSVSAEPKRHGVTNRGIPSASAPSRYPKHNSSDNRCHGCPTRLGVLVLF